MLAHEHDTTAAGAAQRLVDDGFAVLADACDDELVERVLAVSMQKLQQAREALGSREIGIGSAEGYDEIVQRSPGRWDVPIEPAELGLAEGGLPWWPVVASVLGADAELSFCGVISSEPGSTDQHWHSDSPHEHTEHLPANAINVLVALQDIPMEMGPTELARGSHRLTNHLRNPALVVDQLVYQHAGTTPESLAEATAAPVPERWASPLSAGSVLLFDDRVLHRGMANRCERTRHVAYLTYQRRGYTTGTYFESKRSVFDE